MKNCLVILVLMIFAGLRLNGQCFEDRHSTNIHDSWLSCETSDNPNTSKPDSHWLLFNLGEPTEIFKSTFWNLNYPTATSNGLQSISIDYSLDSISWISLPNVELEQAPGSSFYEGEEGPDFDGATLQYILITANSNYGGDCFGLSEIRFSTETDMPVSVIENQIESIEINIQPNPFYQNFTFSSDEKIEQIQIFDAVGKLINTLIEPVQHNAINVEHLQSGNYFINFVTSKGSKMHRAVKF